METRSTNTGTWTRVSEDGKSAAAGMSLGSASGTKIGAGHKPQPYGWHGYYGETGGGASSSPVYRGKVTLPHEVRGTVTPPERKGKVIPPPPPPPRQPHLTWDQSKGVLHDEQGQVMTNKGYSGLGDAKNNPSREQEEDHGPIPQGNWRIEEVRDDQFHKRLARPIYRLVPDNETCARVEAMGRQPDSFLIHGDNDTHTASTGCVIVDRNTREQLRVHAGGWIHVWK